MFTDIYTIIYGYLQVYYIYLQFNFRYLKIIFVCQKLWKLVDKHRQSYCNNKQACFFGPPCRIYRGPVEQ